MTYELTRLFIKIMFACRIPKNHIKYELRQVKEIAMTEKDIIKRIVIVFILLIALVFGHIFMKPYLPSIVSKYDDLKQTLLGKEAKTITENSTEENETSQETVQETKSKIDPSQLIRIEFTGSNRKGELNYTIQKSVIHDLKNLSMEEKNQFLDSLKVTFSKEKQLSNQDLIQVKVSTDKKFESYLGTLSFEQKVSGLSEKESFTIKSLEDDINVEFSGFNGKGNATLHTDFVSPFDQLKVIIDQPKANYSNGDELRIIFNQDSIRKLEELGYSIAEDDELIVKVEDLEDPIKIKKEDIDKHVVVNFMGTSGVGEVKLDTTFQPPLSTFLNNESFDIENNGQIRNNEEVTIKIKPDVLDKMKDKGLELTEPIEMTRKAQNLPEVSESIDQTKNVKELIKKINADIEQKYPDTLFGSFDTKLERYYYRPFHVQNDLIKVENSTQDGTLIAVFTVDTLSKDKKEKIKTETLVYGYTNLYTNSKNEIKLKEAKVYEYKYDNTYTLESVFQLIEGYNFKAIKFK